MESGEDRMGRQGSRRDADRRCMSEPSTPSERGGLMAEHWTAGVKGDWSGQDWTGRSGDTARIDPYLVWADATAFDDLGGKPTSWVRVMIELEGETADETPRTARWFAESIESDHKEWQAWIRVSSLYRYPPPGLEQTRFLSAVVTRQFFSELEGSLKGLVKRFELGLAVVPDDAGAPVSIVSPAFGPTTDAGEASAPARD